MDQYEQQVVDWIEDHEGDTQAEFCLSGLETRRGAIARGDAESKAAAERMIAGYTSIPPPVRELEDVGVWRGLWRELRLAVAEFLLMLALRVHPMDRPEVQRVILDAVRRYAALQGWKTQKAHREGGL